MNIAIITARGGSKRIPRKNIRLFLGKPMIAWSIEAAQASGCFEHIIVSTDDREIAETALNLGVQAPFLRPASLADDHAPAHKAARHALEWALQNLGPVSGFCHLYPTAPMLRPETIREGMEHIVSGRFKAAWAMVRAPYPVYQLMTLTQSGGVERLFPLDKATMRSQDMPEAVIDTGQMYCFDTDFFLEHELRVGPELAPVLVPPETAADIDTEDDWLFAESMAQFLAYRRSKM